MQKYSDVRGMNFFNTTIASKRKKSKLFTLIIVKKNENVLLGLKKRGFGVHKWNGFGGKVESGESIQDGAIRELQEECGLIANSLYKHGILWFENLETTDMIFEVHLFSVSDYKGEATESEEINDLLKMIIFVIEMIPKWFNIKDIPFQNMWPSNKYWLPLVIEGKKFDAFFLYKNEHVLDFTINEY
ncbi:hypothetical protein PGB90_002473 [Kerria lacca]